MLFKGILKVRSSDKDIWVHFDDEPQVTSETRCLTFSRHPNDTDKRIMVSLEDLSYLEYEIASKKG